MAKDDGACLPRGIQYNRGVTTFWLLEGVHAMWMRTRPVLPVLILAVTLAAGCGSRQPCQPRQIGVDVMGSLTPGAFREAYRTPAFTVRAVQDGRHVAVQDADLPPGEAVDDTNLLIYVEGSGDRVSLSRHTMALLAESPHGFADNPDRLVVVLLKWGRTEDVVTEHLNTEAQMTGAALLNDMLEIHRCRHGDGGHVSIIGFSAGTRVTQWAFLGKVPDGEDTHPSGQAHTDHVVFLGSSMSCVDPVPFEGIRGRFLSFINPRDTHYGDRAPFVAPAGEGPRLGKFLTLEPTLRHPNFGASVVGFRELPTLTRPEQFDALEGAGLYRHSGLEQAFKRVNVPVPVDLVPFNVFGDPVANDDGDDYVNQAPNHYVLVGRGPAGRVDGPDFAQYREAAAEFVREHVASAALRGRLCRCRLVTKGKSAKLLDIPLPFPWAVLPRPEAPKEAPPAPPSREEIEKDRR